MPLFGLDQQFVVICRMSMAPAGSMRSQRSIATLDQVGGAALDGAVKGDALALHALVAVGAAELRDESGGGRRWSRPTRISPAVAMTP